MQIYYCRNTVGDPLSAFQKWTQKAIPGQPDYIFRLYNPGSNKCLTYYARQYQYLGPVWAENCGLQGQGWTSYKGGFRAVENPNGYLAPIYTGYPTNAVGVNLQPEMIVEGGITSFNQRIWWHVRW
ncbi:hypothetical protein ACH47V_27360 [Micromonospora chersina]|uniref:hypothetical protein n=1 Tax=Micromonospora chersina TaxID=47854 RepID=UPI0033CC5B4A